MNSFCNKEQNIYDSKERLVNPDGENAELYTKDLLKTQKILIVMLWDSTLDPNKETEFIHPDYISKPSKPGLGCIATAIEHYGITLKIVRNYESAIQELTKQTKPGYCDYYATWVFCGPPFAILPEKDQNPNLIGQFIDVLIQFWHKGGSIVFMCDKDPLFYQVNLFLQKVEFDNETGFPSKKTLLRIEGKHQGGSFLIGDESGMLEKIRTFNRSIQYQRSKLSHNIFKLFEGKNNSFACYNLEFIMPFKPFSRDSEGGISSLFYSANLTTGTGDIIIDCGYSKFFTDFDADGIFRYVQNIAGWTARPEIHVYIDKIDPKEWRPKAVEHTIQRNVICNEFNTLKVDPKKLRTLWAIDASESIKDNDFYHNQLRKILDEYHKGTDEYYLWSDFITELTLGELYKFIDGKRGYKGTKSSLIAEIACKSFIRDHLIIVTDGSVDQGEIDKSDNLIFDNKIKFKYVTTFIINEGIDPIIKENLANGMQLPDYELEKYKIKCDLSVCSPYCRNCPYVVYHIKSEFEREELFHLDDFELNHFNDIDNICTLEKFYESYHQLPDIFKKITFYKSDNVELGKKIDDLYLRVMRSIKSPDDQRYFEHHFNALLPYIYDNSP